MNGQPGAMRESARRDRTSLQLGLEWIGLGALLVVFAVYVGFELWRSRQAIEARERDRLEQQAHFVEKRLGDRMQAASNSLEALRSEAPGLLLRADGISLLNERMRVMVSSMAGVRTFVLVNADGIVVSSNRKELIGGDWHDGERYRTIRSRPDAATLYVSPPFMTPLGNWALSVGRAILDRRGGFDGYVLAIFDPGYFEILLDSTRYAPDMVAEIVHGGGTIIYRLPDPTGAVGLKLAGRPGEEALIVLRTIRPSTSPSDGFLVAAFSRETSAVFAPWRAEVKHRVTLLAVVALAVIPGLFFHQRRRMANARLQARLEGSARLAALGTLVAGVAHEINNPLTALMASAGTALEEVRAFREGVREGPGLDRDRVLQHSDDILDILVDVGSSAERIARVVKDLAILGRPVQHKERVGLAEVVRNTLRLLPPAVAQRAEIRTDLVDVPDVMASASQMEQVLTNLVANAALAFPGERRGDILVRLGPGARGQVRLEVEDDGPGIPPELLERIFEPFFTTRPQGQGTGLGLSICNAIVGAHGGTLTVESVVGRGSTFRVELPAAPAEPGAAG